MTVKVYSKPKCFKCDQTYKALDAKGVVYEVFDVSVNEDAFKQAQTYGVRELPLVVCSDQHWSGFRPDLISKL